MRNIKLLVFSVLLFHPFACFCDLPKSEVGVQQTTYSVSNIVFKYDQSHPKQIPVEELEQIPLKKGGMTIDQINQSSEDILLSQSDLRQIIDTLRHYLDSKGINWAVIYVPKNEISETGEDLRSDTVLTIAISTPIVKQASVTYAGKENPKLTEKIENGMPISLPDPSTGYPGDFINSNVLNQYLHSLNRHPDRRVDLEIGPTGIPGEAAIDFVVTEKKPYHFYVSMNNNTPRPVDRWQESVGFIHTQLTGNDDIFKLNASTDSFDRFYTFNASYEAPLYGSIKNRWQVSGSFSRFISAEFALPQNLFVGTQAIGDVEFISNVGQWDKLFLDVVADLQYRHIHNRGHFFFASATKNFLLPAVSLKVIQLKRETKLIASISVQSTMSSLFWDVKKGLDNLGRVDLSSNWAIVQGDLYGSFYLESLFQKSDKVKHLAHEIVAIGQFQNAFHQRLIPQLEGVLGGLYTVRGYPQSTISGDNFYMGSLEYRFHLPKIFRPRKNATVKIFGQPLRWAPREPKGDAEWDFVLRGFYDVGQTTVNERRHFERNYLIMGAGCGAELVMWQNLFVRADWAVGLRAANGIRSGNRQFYFSTTVIF
jgi:hemolysin activation/secretion protein